MFSWLGTLKRCNSTYRLRYWNHPEPLFSTPQRKHWSCNSTYRLRYWNVLGGSRTLKELPVGCNSTYRLRYWNRRSSRAFNSVERCCCCNSTYRLRYWNQFLVPPSLPSWYASCNSTYRLRYWNAYFSIGASLFWNVATVLTACGIETVKPSHSTIKNKERLQQYLPLAVLKQRIIARYSIVVPCCNSTYRLRYWNAIIRGLVWEKERDGCNSTYRLRYWNRSDFQCYR